MISKVLAFLLAALLSCGSDGASRPGPSPSPTPTPTPPGTCTLDPAACAFLAVHDAARAAATPAPSPPLPAMSWSTAAASAASAWAAQCDWSHDPALGALGLGQNLYASTAQPAPAQVVASWASEGASYDYASNSCASGQVCGHYTQVVWRASTGLGCATVRCTTGSPFGSLGGGVWWNVACDYAPPGNFVGQRPY